MAVSPNDLLQSAEAYSFIAKNEADQIHERVKNYEPAIALFVENNQ